ncbi:MAG: glycerophosphodiester phosphodiesterase family protein [Terricaulis silvestris]
MTTPRSPWIIAHRGASGERPEHTMAAYRLAIAQGADFIEPDLLVSKDGVLVCRHDDELSSSTDVAARSEFVSRRATKTIDGTEYTGWFVEDFTLAELKTLRCKEPWPHLRPTSAAYDGQEAIVTFAELLELARAAKVGVVPELKHVGYLRGLGFDPVVLFVAAVRQAGGQEVADGLFVEAFEATPLLTLAAMSSLRFNLVQLIGSMRPKADFVDPHALDDASLAGIAEYARAISVEKSLIMPRAPDGAALLPTDLVTRAHRAGLKVFVWTFRAENTFLPLQFRRGDPSDADHYRAHGDLAAELRAFYALGVDGVFCDFPAVAVAAR